MNKRLALELIANKLNAKLQIHGTPHRFYLDPLAAELAHHTFGVKLFNLLIPACSHAVAPDIQQAADIFARCKLKRSGLAWRNKHRGKLSKLSWRYIPYRAAMGALSPDDAGLLRLMLYTVKALTIECSQHTSMRRARKSMREDDHQIWANLAILLAQSLVKV